VQQRDDRLHDERVRATSRAFEKVQQ
jgi:hypothetical protein